MILLVEDNPNDALLTVRAFKKAGILNEMVVASDGEEALEYMFGTGRYDGRDVAQLPQVILLDLKLPKVDGLEVLKRLREDPRTKAVPIVILTSSSEERDLISAYNLHTNAYVQKPVDFVQFAEACKHLGMFWLLLNKTCPNVESLTDESTLARFNS
jgi:two-component system response regulator